MDQNDQEIVRACLAEMRATLMAAKPETQLGANERIVWLSNIIAARTGEMILPDVRLG